MELCYIPFDIEDALRGSIDEPPATMLVLPNGWVKVAAALPYICADLRRDDVGGGVGSVPRRVADASAVRRAIRGAIGDESRHAEANTWKMVPVARV